MDKKSILILGSILELLLIILYFTWVYFSGHNEAIEFGLKSVSLGVGFALVLLVCNGVFLRLVLKRGEGESYEFITTIIMPLVLALDTPSALYVSVLAGVGEELFFRGFLQNEFGIILSSLAFALLHFGPAALQFKRTVLLYFGFSLGFAGLYVYAQSLSAPIIAHIIYDFLALEYLRRTNVMDS